MFKAWDVVSVLNLSRTFPLTYLLCRLVFITFLIPIGLLKVVLKAGLDFTEGCWSERG